jgi:predicted S18 family serine protease
MNSRLLVLILIVSLGANAVFLTLLASPVSPGIPAQIPVPGRTAQNSSCRNCEDLLQFYQSQLAGGTCIGNRTGADQVRFAAMQAPAVMTTVQYVRRGPFILEQTSDSGAIMNVSVEILPGEGRVLVQTRPLMGVVFQDAANTAVGVAENRTKKSLSKSDVIFSIEAGSEIPEVDGPSAGALMTVLVEAAINNRVPRQDVTLTGTIDPGGHVGAIGGVIQKATAAKEAGKTLFLLPQENSQLAGIIQGQGRFGSPDRQTVDAREYIEQNMGITVQYVDSIQDVEQAVLG